MRFVVLGAGAIGGAVGARLYQKGFDVTLVARGEHGRALASGLVLEAPDETLTLPIPTVSDPAQVAWEEDGTVVLLAVKGQHTEHALTQLTVAPPSTPVVCMQNGVENERRVLRHFPHTYGMCVMCPATQLRPGVVQLHSAPVSGMLDLGCYPTGIDDAGQAIADAIATTTFQSVARADIMRWKYRKLLMNLANAVEALSGPEGRFSPLAREAQREGTEALAAAGIDVASSEEDRARRADNLQLSPTSSGEWQGGSSWQSLARGAGSIEAEFLNGEIVLLGRLHGVPTPVNALLQRLAVHAAAAGCATGLVADRGPERAGGGAPWRVSGRRHWPTTSWRRMRPHWRSPRPATEREWALSVPGEGWTVGVVLHHIAEGHAHGARWLQDMARGEGVTETAEDIDRVNAAHAVRAEAVGPAETVALLEVNGDVLEEALRGLSDEELDRTAPFGPAGGRRLPTVDLAAVAARHARAPGPCPRCGGPGALSPRLFQSQSPLPATRSTLIRMTYPGGGSSMGGNLTSGPM